MSGTDEKSEKPTEKKQPKVVTTPEIAKLEAEIAATRLQLASTADALSERLVPARLAQDAVDEGRAFVSAAFDAEAPAAARQRSRITLGVATAVVAVLVLAAVRRR